MCPDPADVTLLGGDSNSAGWNPKLGGGDRSDGVAGFERGGSLWYPPGVPYRCFFSDWGCKGPRIIFPSTLRATGAMLPPPLPPRSGCPVDDRNLVSFGGGAGGGIGVSICALILCFLRRRQKNSHAEMAMTKAAAPEPMPIPMACLVVMALRVADPGPGGPGVSGADRDVGGATGSVAEAKGETYSGMSVSDPGAAAGVDSSCLPPIAVH